MTHSPVTYIKYSAGSGPKAFEMTALTKTKNGARHAIKTPARIEGFQEGGIDNDDAPLSLVVAGKVHAFVEASDLFTIAIEHLCSHAIGVEE